MHSDFHATEDVVSVQGLNASDLLMEYDLGILWAPLQHA